VEANFFKMVINHVEKIIQGSSLLLRRLQNKLDLKKRHIEILEKMRSLQHARLMVKTAIKCLREKAIFKGEKLYWPQQERIARQVYNGILYGYVAFLICALCQAGKSGVALALLEICMQENPNFNPDDFFIITGLDSVDWLDQMKERFPESWREKNIFRRSGSKFKNHEREDFANVIEGRDDIIIIIDEIHLVSSYKMTIGKMFKSIGMDYDGDFVRRNISVVGLTATPGKVQTEFENFWNSELYLPLRMEPGEGYTGLRQLVNSGRVRQCSPLIIKGDDGRPLIDLKVVAEISRTIREIPFKTINFIRVPAGWDASLPSNQDELRRYFTSALREDVCVRSYTQHDSVSLDSILEQLGAQSSGEPVQPIILLLKEKLRVAKTLKDPRFLGVMWERPTTQPAVAIQGLPGRICGYKTNAHSVVFTNLDHIEKYIEWWDDGCRAIKGRGPRANTWIGTTGSSNNRLETSDMLVKFFEVKDELITWADEKLGAKTGRDLPEDKTVFHICFLRKSKKPQTCDWVERNKGNGFGKSSSLIARSYSCYKDINDSTTLMYALCYRPHHVRT